MNAGELFNHNGFMINPLDKYFDVNDTGELWINVSEYVNQNYKEFPIDSELVAMYFAEKYAAETHGNYSPLTLFSRAR